MAGGGQESFAEVLVAAGAHGEGAGLGADDRSLDQHVVGEVDELQEGGVRSLQTVGADQGLRVTVRGADDEERAALGDDAAKEGMVGHRRELVFERERCGARLVPRRCERTTLAPLSSSSGVVRNSFG